MDTMREFLSSWETSLLILSFPWSEQQMLHPQMFYLSYMQNQAPTLFQLLRNIIEKVESGSHDKYKPGLSIVSCPPSEFLSQDD